MSESVQPGFEQRWQRRRSEFLTRALVNADGAVDLVRALYRDCDNLDALLKLSKYFHKLAGAGGIYELERLSEISIPAEDYCAYLESSGRMPNNEDLVHLSRYVECIRQCLREYTH